LPLPTRQDAAGLKAGSLSGPCAPGLLKPYSELWAFLTTTQLPDGSKRLPGRISFSFARGVLSVSLTDEDTGLFVCRSGKVLDDVLLVLESGLAASELDWGVSKYPSRGKR